MGEADNDALTSTRIDDREQVSEVLASLLAGAQRRVKVFAPHIPLQLFNSAAVRDALAHFATLNRHNEVRILIEHTAQVARDNERLIELSRRLSDFIKLRQVAAEHNGAGEMFVIVDGISTLQQPDLAKPEWALAMNDRARATELARRFDQMWARSEHISGIQPLGI